MSEEKERIFIGVAWPYSNGSIHVGGIAGCYLPPDIFARYHRMKGSDVLMVSGSDMHGTPTTVKADAEGISPAEVANKYHALNSESLRRLGIEFDLFLSTEEPTHIEVAQGLFKRLHEYGFIYEKDMQLPYCQSCDRYLPDRYVEGTCPHCGSAGARGDQCDECGKLLDPDQLIDIVCKNCGSTPEFQMRTHFFFRLSAFEDYLSEYLEQKRPGWRPNVVSFTENWLKMGLKDRPVSRDINWGIEIPIEGHEDKRIYVWFEAFMGYYSMAVEHARRGAGPGNEAEADEILKSWWENPACRHYYFLGKDNIPFHTIFWPAVIMAVNLSSDEPDKMNPYTPLNLPYDVPANMFMRFSGEKFSKSRGTSLGIDKILDDFEPDALRYYISINMPEIRDADFSWDDMIAKNNNELLATYGNFVHRVLHFTHKNFGEMPEPGELDDEDKQALASIEETYAEATQRLDKCQFKDALKAIMALARNGNVYFDSKAPWALLKEDKVKCAAALHVSLKYSQALAVMMAPYLPFSSDKIWRSLGYAGSVHDEPWSAAVRELSVGQKLAKPEPLFAKIERDESAADNGGSGKPVEGDDKEGVSDVESDYARFDLRVGKIAEISNHPDAEKLYIMKVDLGDEERTLVAGLRPYYAEEALQGACIVVLCNLEPAELRGVESKGMMLAGEKKGVVSLLTPLEDAPPGTQIKGTTKGAGVLAFAEFKQFFMKVGKLQGDKINVGNPIGYSGAVEAKYDGMLATAFLGKSKLPESCIVLETENGVPIGVDPSRQLPLGAKIH